MRPRAVAVVALSVASILVGVLGGSVFLEAFLVGAATPLLVQHVRGDR